jgi:heat-inducible transcriptional repressor
VECYIETGEPVASGDISRMRRFHISPATIRMVMAELAAEGYLQQPHTSAGRVPTDKAFEAFVSQLPSHRVQSSELGRIRESLSGAGTVDKRVERSCRMLTEMTSGLGITAAIPSSAQTLEQIELVWLGSRRVLMVVVTSDRMVRDHVVDLDTPVTPAELATVRNYVNREFGGWVIPEIRKELQARLESAKAAYDQILSRLNLLYEKGLLDIGMAPEIHLDGAANVVGFDLHLTRDRLKELLQALEEKRLVLRLLDRFLAEAPGGGVASGPVRVKIGLDGDVPGFGAMSLIGISVAMPGGTSAKFAVLGPMRMDYSRAMSAVLHMGRAFSSMPS